MRRAKVHLWAQLERCCARWAPTIQRRKRYSGRRSEGWKGKDRVIAKEKRRRKIDAERGKGRTGESLREGERVRERI